MVCKCIYLTIERSRNGVYSVIDFIAGQTANWIKFVSNESYSALNYISLFNDLEFLILILEFKTLSCKICFSAYWNSQLQLVSSKVYTWGKLTWLIGMIADIDILGYKEINSANVNNSFIS